MLETHRGRNQVVERSGIRIDVVSVIDLQGYLDFIFLRRNGGRRVDDAIDDLLSDYELLDAACRNNLIDKDIAYDAFSYDLYRKGAARSQGEAIPLGLYGRGTRRLLGHA